MEKIDYEKPVWNLLQKIVKKFKENDFKNSRLKFSPIEEGYKTDWKTKLNIWKIPAELKTVTKGKKPFRLGF